MVRILSLILLKRGIIIHKSFALSSFGFFQRNTVKETCIFSSREVSLRTLPGTSQSIEHAGHFCYVYSLQNELSVCCVTDKEYPSYFAMNFLVKVINIFQENVPKEEWENVKEDMDISIPELSALLDVYQDPTKVEKIETIKKELNETIQISTKTIDQILERGEKIEDLLDRTKDLSNTSKEFMIETKRMNKCCVLF
jgi:synaptobrevin homolog YKT6